MEILRVSQLDGSELDDQLAATLRGRLQDILAPWQKEFWERWEPEMAALLRFLTYGVAISTLQATVGLKVMRLKYRDERRHGAFNEGAAKDAPITNGQKFLWTLYHVGGRWAWARIHRLSIRQGWSELPPENWKNRLWHWLNRLETVYLAISLLNFLAFLYNGKYRSIIDRVLRMRLVYREKEIFRSPFFEYLNRQLVWQVLTDFLLFVLPLVQYRWLASLVERLTPRSRRKQEDLPAWVCSVCKSDVELPHITNCGHLYCYFCLRSRMMADPKFACSRCGTRVEKVERLRPSSDSPAASSSTATTATSTSS